MLVLDQLGAMLGDAGELAEMAAEEGDQATVQSIESDVSQAEQPPCAI